MASGATLVVAPLAIARGVQNKVLEAMAMARPLLVTGAAATGIGAHDGSHLAIADTPGAMIDRALALLGNPAAARAMGQAARALVVERFGWERAGEALRGLIAGEPGDAA